MRTSLTIAASALFLAVPALALAQSQAAPKPPAPVVGFLKIEGSPPERLEGPAAMFGSTERLTMRDLLRKIDAAAAPDRNISGLVLRLYEPQLSLTQAEEIGAAIERLRKTGRKAHLFTEIYGPAEIMLGTYADEVIVQRGGAVSFPGLYSEEIFLADALRWLGVTPDFVQIGDYKGAKEMFANSAPSPQWDQNINLLLDSIFANMTGRLAAGRNLKGERLDKALAGALMADGQTAVALGLVDRSLDRLELDDHLDSAYGGNFAWDPALSPKDKKQAGPAQMGLFEAFAELMRAIEGGQRRLTRDTIAILHIDGAIIDGESTTDPIFGGSSVGSLTIRKTLERIGDDSRIRGLIVRINSPGGSAIASESMWLGLQRVAGKKPVWASIGSMAASGGYYVAVGTQKIYVNPSSIVGSIGVVGGKLALGGVYEKLHVNVVPRSRGPMAGVFGLVSPWNEPERALIRKRMEETYDQFVQRVQAGRRGIDIARTAEGRLFTGSRAIDMKMADVVGGLDVAIADMAETLDLSPAAYDVVDFPEPRSLDEILQDFMVFGSSASAAGLDGDNHGLGPTLISSALREALGPRAWPQVRDALGALMQMRRQPVLLVSPRIVVIP